MFKNFIIIFILFSKLFISTGCAHAEVISGNVKREEVIGLNQVVDKVTGEPIMGAIVSIPNINFKTYTDANGNFKLDTKINKIAILSVEKDGYRQLSVTIRDSSLVKPMKLAIEQRSPKDLAIEHELCHLGDNVFSDTSANSSDFKSKTANPYYNKQFKLEPLTSNETAYLIIGSVIGLDTKMARDMGQNMITSAYSSPAEVFFNGQKIAELRINGDNQEILIPSQLIYATNNLTIRTGKNLFQRSYTDYDDIEIMNMSIEIRQKQVFGLIAE